MFFGETLNGATILERGGKATHVWVIPLTNSPASIHECLSWLDDYEVARMRSLKFVVDRIMYVESHSWLRRLLSEYTGIAPAALRFSYSRLSKPALGLRSSEGMPRIRFSLSHTDGCAAVAISSEGEVGVDVERLRSIDSLDELGLTVLHPYERALLERMESRGRYECFFRLWTAKEAYTKALGSGLTHPFDKLSVKFSDTPQCEIDDENQDAPKGSFNHWSMLMRLPADGEFALGVSSRDGSGAIVVQTVNSGSRPTDAALQTSPGNAQLR